MKKTFAWYVELDDRNLVPCETKEYAVIHANFYGGIVKRVQVMTNNNG